MSEKIAVGEAVGAARENSGAIVAYLCHRTAVEGAHVLMAMKDTVDAGALRCGSMPCVYYVDSGRADGSSAYGHALMRLVLDARRGKFATVVVVNRAAFAEDERMAASAIRALEAAGVRVLEVAPVAVETGSSRVLEPVS